MAGKRLITCIILCLIPLVVWATGNESITSLPAQNPNASSYSAQRTWMVSQEAGRELRRNPRGWVYNGGIHATASGKTSAAFAADAITSSGNRVTADGSTNTTGGGSVAITYGSLGCADNDTAWVIISAASGNSLTNFSRNSGSNYFVNCVDATQPALPSDSTWLMKVTISGGNITSIEDKRAGHASIPEYLYAELPASCIRGQMSFVTDSVRGLWVCTGTQWVRQDPVIDLQRDFNMVCDGSTDDATTLNTAIAAKTATYATYRLPIGTCILGAKITGASSLTLVGQGAGLSILKQKASTQVNDTLLDFGTASKVTLRDFTCDGNRANQGVPVRRLVCLGFTQATDVRVENVEVTGSYGDGAGSVGIGLSFGGSSNRVWVRNNYLHDLGTTTYTSDAMYFSGSHLFAANNQVDTYTDTGIVCEATSTSAASPSRQCLIVANNFEGPNGQAIAVDAAIANTYSSDNVIALNAVRGGSGTNGGAIRVFKSSGTAVSNAVVLGNIVDDTTLGKGIYLSKTTHGIVASNIVTGLDADQAGVFAEDTDHSIFGLNASYDNGGTGIGLQGNTYPLVVGNHVVNNGLVSGAPSGFDIRNSSTPTTSSRVAMVGNLSSLTQTYGIQTAGTISQLYVASNYLSGNGSGGFNFTATVTDLVRVGNRTSNTTGAPEWYDFVSVGPSVTFASLFASTQDGETQYCSDCQVTSGADNTCKAGGSGALAIRIGGATRCFALQN